MKPHDSIDYMWEDQVTGRSGAINEHFDLMSIMPAMNYHKHAILMPRLHAPEGCGPSPNSISGIYIGSWWWI